MKRISFLLLAILLLSACELELSKVDVNFEDGFVSEAAVSSFLIPDSLVSMKLVMSKPAYSNSNSKIIVKKAVVQQVQDNRVFTLLQNPKVDYVELYSKELLPVAGGIYKMRVETQNPTAIIESIDTIPPVTAILDADILPVEKSSTQLCRITFKPNPDLKVTSYYELAILICYKSSQQSSSVFYQTPLTTRNQIITREDYYPSLLLIGAFEPQSLLFRITNPDEIVNIDFLCKGIIVQSSKGISTIDHELKIELRSVSCAYFKYKTSLYKQINAANGDLLYGMAAPVTVLSNVKGGRGVFAGYSKSDTIIHVAGRTGLLD